MKKRTASKIRIIERRKKVLKLYDLYQSLNNCTRCSHNLRASGFGDSMSTVMLVGQSLHGECHETGTQVPFIGPMEVDSGDVLFAGIEKAGSRPEYLWITNLVKCHPPGNRANLISEEDSCWPYLLEEIRIIRPIHIIALGNSAHNGLLRYSKRKVKVMGRPYHHAYFGEKGGFSIKTRLHKIQHPSWAMRMGEAKELEWIDWFAHLLGTCLKGNK